MIFWLEYLLGFIKLELIFRQNQTMKKVTEETKKNNPAGKLYELLFDRELAYPSEQRTIEVINRACENLNEDSQKTSNANNIFGNLQLINNLIEQTESSVSEILEEISETTKRGFEKIKQCFYITNLETSWNQYTFDFQQNKPKIDDHAKIALENYANLISLKEQKRIQILSFIQKELDLIKSEIETTEELEKDLKEILLQSLGSIESITKTYYKGRKQIGKELFACLGKLNTLKWLYPSDPWFRKVCSKLLKLCVTNSLPFVHNSQQEVSEQTILESCKDQFEAFLQKNFEKKEEFQQEFRDFNQILKEPDLFPLFMISRSRRLIDKTNNIAETENKQEHQPA